MKGIVPPKIVINELRVERLSPNKRFMDISFGYGIGIENLETSGKIVRRFALEDNVINFILAAMSDLKKVAGTETAEFVDHEEIKEKLVNTMERLSLEVTDLEKIKDHESYMKAFNRVHCYKNTFEV